jgi:TonB family protein
MFEPARSQNQKHPLLPGALAPNDPKQRRLMLTALALLLVSLGIVLYRDRDFWFPDSDEAADQVQQPASRQTVLPSAQASAKNGVKRNRPEHGNAHLRSKQPEVEAAVVDEERQPVSVTRTVLPPLDVEVVAGTVHRTLHPGSNSVKLDMQPGESSGPGDEPQIVRGDAAASITVNAAEQTPIASEPADVVSRSVQPSYPMLARQMKVQGSVILQALIGRDGLIQDLRIVDGPPILANAALVAVKQWHFKPHYQGTEPVETQAKITVNFTISTN